MISNFLPSSFTLLYTLTRLGVKARHGPHCVGVSVCVCVCVCECVCVCVGVSVCVCVFM